MGAPVYHKRVSYSTPAPSATQKNSFIMNTPKLDVYGNVTDLISIKEASFRFIPRLKTSKN